MKGKQRTPKSLTHYEQIRYVTLLYYLVERFNFGWCMWEITGIFRKNVSYAEICTCTKTVNLNFTIWFISLQSINKYIFWCSTKKFCFTLNGLDGFDL